MQYRFQQGKVMVNCACFLGYDKDADGKLVINPKQAETVKRIFREYRKYVKCRPWYAETYRPPFCHFIRMWKHIKNIFLSHLFYLF